MENLNPATPAQAATPGSGTPGSNPPSVTPPASTPNGAKGTPEGTVTIPLKEYRNLQRGAARALSFDKRIALGMGKPKSEPGQSANGGNDDPEIVEQLQRVEQARLEVERENLQLKVRGQVRDLLDKEEFKVIPKSTRELILKNPAMLSKADSVEEAMLDIEDFLREQILSGETPSNGGKPQDNPPKETPPPINNGTPAPGNPQGLEDVSNLRGMDKTAALIRNQIKVQKGIK